VVLAPVAYMSMFTGFHAYDDEGYYLANLGDYMSGHPLLTQYAQVYGPFFYEVVGGLFKLLGLAADNDSGRLVTAAIWVLASLGGGLVAFRLSGNLWLGLTSLVLTFGVLAVLTNEPMSTYGLSELLFLGLAAAACFRSARPRATAASIGAIVGALCLIKINVGAFAAVAVAFAWAGSLSDRWRRLLFPAMLVVITAVPVLLMFPLLTTGWVLEFALLVSLAAAALGVASVGVSPRSLPAPSLMWIAGGGAALVLVSIAIALAGGTRPVDAWQGMVVLPLRFPRLFTLPVRLNPGYDAVAALSFAAALIASIRRSVAVSPATGGVARVGVGLFMWLSMLFMPDSTFLLALPLAWVATRAPDTGGDDTVGPYARLLLPVLAVLESLQPYPIAGSQLSMAALGLIPVGAIVLGDGVRQLRSLGATIRTVSWVAPAALVINVTVFLLFALTVIAGFRSDTALGLRGAGSVRLPAQSAAQLRELVAAVDRNCSSFVTFPGMDSLYIWTAQQPPTPVRAEVWWLVLDANQQQSLVQQLAARPRLCVIKNQRTVDMWSQGGAQPTGPLVSFIDQEFVDDSSYGDYELLVRGGP